MPGPVVVVVEGADVEVVPAAVVVDAGPVVVVTTPVVDVVWTVDVGAAVVVV